ncbi:MAG: SUMF1/EgtB/PvdO family nonheme iron enzyme, partial [Cyanobium sp.]
GFSRNPLEPAYGPGPDGPLDPPPIQEEGPIWLDHPGGLIQMGQGEPETFAFDNDGPRHRLWLEPFAIARRLVSNAEYAAFLADDGYRRPELWMSEGWACVQERGWQAPRYWRGDWEFTLAGRRPRQGEAPVRHLSWFEADAYARWAGARLPSEAEWETAATTAATTAGGDASGDASGEIREEGLPQAFGLLWQWTSSPYRPYPGFRTAAGAVGEYNGKFMTSQFVLRGSAFLTPDGHGRPSYRNFFPPASRWMASGLRLARDR